MARRTLAAASLAAVILSGCGSSAPSAPPTERPSPITTASAAAAAPSPTGTPSPTATPDPVKALQAAVVQIQLTGPFSEPGHAPGRFVRSGSGFFVDPSGLVLTNNHVATGAGKLTVWVGPDRTEHAAQVVGASECSDLALLKVAGDGPFTALDWYEGDIGPGLAIYAAGYPLGDPEFTLTSGIVSRARGVIDEAWASVDHTIEHDATINPGSSGGPVVTHDGQVVGVNYAERDSTRQQFAIGREDARAILPELTAGHDVASIGIHGEVTDADLGTGVWVDAVRPDSPAAEAGIEPGNVITSLDGVDLGDDHTLKTYCDILRRHQPEDVLGVEVMRDQDVAPVDGQINGEPLPPPFSFARLLADGPTVDPVDQAVAEVHDLLETITFDAPADWRDVEDQDWTFGGEVVGPGVLVSTEFHHLPVRLGDPRGLCRRTFRRRSDAGRDPGRLPPEVPGLMLGCQASPVRLGRLVRIPTTCGPAAVAPPRAS